MSNLTKEVRGVDRTVGELLYAVPDVDAFLSDLDEIEANMNERLRTLAELRRQEKALVLALESDIRLLQDLVSRGHKEWLARKGQIEAGAEDLGLQMPRLGFRIIKPLPQETA